MMTTYTAKSLSSPQTVLRKRGETFKIMDGIIDQGWAHCHLETSRDPEDDTDDDGQWTATDRMFIENLTEVN